MFLLLWLQTIPSQTALSGANPISRRIAELSGCAGVCAPREDSGSHWERGCAARCFAPLACPPRPAKAKWGSVGQKLRSSWETIFLFKQQLSQGAWESCVAPRCSSTCSPLAPTQDTKGDRGLEVSEIRIRLCCFFAVRMKWGDGHPSASSWLQSLKMAIPPNFRMVYFVLHTPSRKLISAFNL